MEELNRREFIRRTGATLAFGGTVRPRVLSAENATPRPDWLPRWRGFNLLEKFTARPEGNPPFAENDFVMMSEWGFDFVRLAMSYHCWADADPASWLRIRPAEIAHIDDAIEYGWRWHVHVNINFHRIPGYCVNPPSEPLDLWTDAAALDAAAHHWAYFARRYRGVPNERLSFNPINEPPDIAEETYVRVMRHLIAAIRAEDPARLIIADGLRWARDPVLSLAGDGVAQSTRGYYPMRISHWQASWVSGSDLWPEPDWPLTANQEIVWDKERLRRERILPWQALQAQGVGIHVGEWGAFHRTPHAVTLAWMRDNLELWKEAGWGWALWSLAGQFGVLDSYRSDVTYARHRGHDLDRAMLAVLRTG